MTIPQAEPVPPEAVAALLADSDRAAAELAARLAAWADGYRAGAAHAERQYGRGYVQAAADAKAVAHAVYDFAAGQARAERDRWTVRGERRTRQAFSQPHPGDYKGGPVPAW